MNPSNESRTEEAGAAALPPRRPGIIRRLYDWVLHWADHPAGPWMLFLLATLESFIFPIPPDVLLIALCLGRPQQAWKFAAICTAGSVIGGMLGFYIGLLLFQQLGQPILEMYGAMDAFDHLGQLYRDNLIPTVAAAGFTPIPYKVFTIAAGAFVVPFLPFILTSLVSRGARFFLVAGLVFRFGPPVKVFIDKYFNLLTVVFMVLLIGGFVLVRWFAG
jgi:membrane protein YqaA with SNARE-associated domain